MNSRLIYAAFWLIFTIWNFYDWRKNKDKDLLWFMGFGAMGFFAELIYSYLIATSASQNTLSIVGVFNKIIDVIGGAMFVFILIENLRRNGKK